MDDLTFLWLAILLTALSAYFGAATFALRRLSRVRLAKVLERRNREPWLDWITERAVDFMMAAATIRLLANIGLILLTMALFEGHIANPMLHYLLVLLVAGGVILLFGLAIADAWAKYAGEELITTTWLVLQICRLILKPVIVVLKLTDEIVRRLVGAPKLNLTDEAEQIGREILDAVSEGEKHGAVDETEKEMIESVIELRETHVGQIMTPRTEVIALDVGSTVDDARELIMKEGHSRIPLFEGTIDQVVGVLYAKDLLKINGDHSAELRDLMRTVPFVPESKPLRDLLREFQESKIHLAIVIDEYGGTAGVVTFEDLLEELVGEIVDEYEPPEPEPFVMINDDTVEADAKLRIDEINDELDIELPEGKDYDTVGGFVLSEMGKIPSVGDELVCENVQIEILDADDRRINRVRVSVDRSQPAERTNGAE